MGIFLKNIIKTYNQEKINEAKILKDITLEINNGQMVAIIGRSGAGKSTLMHIIGCLDTMTNGEYYLDDIDISKFSNKKIAAIRNKKFGFVMQDFGLINEDSVFMNVALPMLLGNAKMRNIHKTVDETLNNLGILELKDRLVEGLSGGEKQRVAIARALVNKPDYILADEPTGSLDTENADYIMEILIELHSKGKTIIIVTHDNDVAAKCDEIIKIADGKICYE